MKKILIICQARYGSTRLPGKVLLNIIDKPLLYYVIKRLKQVKTPNNIIIATPNSDENKPIIELAKDLKVNYFTGSEEDVLDRYYQASKNFNGEIIVRITSDCPLADPQIIDKGINLFLNGKYDYVSNIDPPTYPDGFDTEIFSFEALERAWNESKLHSEREHVTLYIRNKKNGFICKNFKNNEDFSKYRLTVDTKEDFQLISKIIEKFYNNWDNFTMKEIVNFLKQNPQLKDINLKYKRDI